MYSVQIFRDNEWRHLTSVEVDANMNREEKEKQEAIKMMDRWRSNYFNARMESPQMRVVPGGASYR